MKRAKKQPRRPPTRYVIIRHGQAGRTKPGIHEMHALTRGSVALVWKGDLALNKAVFVVDKGNVYTSKDEAEIAYVKGGRLTWCVIEPEGRTGYCEVRQLYVERYVPSHYRWSTHQSITATENGERVRGNVLATTESELEARAAVVRLLDRAERDVRKGVKGLEDELEAILSTRKRLKL